MNRARTILFVILAFVSVSCSKLLDLRNNAEKEPDPVPVSMEYDGIYIKENLPERTQSQFYLRKHSFSYFHSTYFTEGGLQIRMLISSGEGFELDKWYNLPTAETENIWESFAEIEYDKGYFPNEEDKKATAGKVKFTKFKQEGKLNYTGEGYCTIEGEFEITLENKKPSENAIEIKKGKFYVPKSKYWDSRAMED